MKFLKYHLLLVFFSLSIIILSSIPGDSLPDYSFSLSDKVIHFVIYFVLYIAALISFSHIEYGNISSEPFIDAMIFLIIFAISDEIHQYFVPLRSCDIWDVAADICGGLAAMIFSKKFFKRRLFKY